MASPRLMHSSEILSTLHHAAEIGLIEPPEWLLTFRG